MKETIRKYVLKNAFDFNGSVNPKAVLGIVLRYHPELKKNVPQVLQEIEALITEVVKLSQDERKEELQNSAPELLAEEKAETVAGPLKALPNAVKGRVVVRIAPSPSGALHIGHAYGASLNYEYAKMYDGKFLLRIEDTNPENIYEKAYELIERDARWLTENHVDTVVIQSGQLGVYYDHAEKLVEMNKAYVCTCNADEWRELKNKGEACPCRSLEQTENQLRYAKMFNGYAEGEAVLRLKTDIKNKNPAMRDFPIMRINEHIHPKMGKEQRVWPLMVFSVAIDDHEMGVTHVLNGKDHADNAKKEAIIMEYLGWHVPQYKHWGRINFKGFTLSTSQTRRAIEQNQYAGWDDIRLPFLPALRRRGYQPEAFRRFALEIGLSLNDKTVSKEEFWKMVNAFNKEIVEPRANRYFFVEEPVTIVLENAPQKKVLLNLHPDDPQRGTRTLLPHAELHIAASDHKKLGQDKIHRLMDYCNFTIIDGKYRFFSEDYEEYKNAENKGFIIHWLPAQDDICDVEVMLEDGSIAQGVGEPALRDAKTGDIIQLERMFFARVDAQEKNKIRLWYLHG